MKISEENLLKVSRKGVVEEDLFDVLSGHRLRFLGVPEFSHNSTESFTSFINCRSKILIFRGERRIREENRVESIFTIGDFRAIKVDSGVLFEAYVFLFDFYTL